MVLLGPQHNDQITTEQLAGGQNINYEVVARLGGIYLVRDILSPENQSPSACLIGASARLIALGTMISPYGWVGIRTARRSTMARGTGDRAHIDRGPLACVESRPWHCLVGHIGLGILLEKVRRCRLLVLRATVRVGLLGHQSNLPVILNSTSFGIASTITRRYPSNSSRGRTYFSPSLPFIS